MADAEKPKTWTADTLLRKFYGITDPKAQALARDNLKTATSSFVSRIERNPGFGIRARLVIGCTDAEAAILDLMTDGSLIARKDFELDESGQTVAPPPKAPVDETANWANPMEAAEQPRAARKPDRRSFPDRLLGLVEAAPPQPQSKLALNSYACAFLIGDNALLLGSRYATALSDAAEDAGFDGKTKFGAQRALHHLAKKVVANRIGAQLREFRALLNPDAIKVTSKLLDHRPSFYDAIAGRIPGKLPGNVTHEETVRNRVQFADTYPLLARLLVEAPAFRAKVAAGLPVKEILATTPKMFGEGDLPPELAGKLRGLNWQKTGREAYRKPWEFFETIDATPKDWLPKTRKEWAACQAVYDAGNNPINYARRYDDYIGNAGTWVNNFPAFRDCPDTKTFMKLMGPDWVAAAKKLEKHAGVSGTQDAAKSMTAHLIEPALQRRINARLIERGIEREIRRDGLENHYDPGKIALDAGRKIAADRLLSSYTLARALEMSAEWHDRISHVQNAAAEIRSSQNEEVRWGKAVPDWKAPNGLTVVMLASEAELRDEGERMNQCVGGYASECIQRSIILSVRTEAGESLSTAQLDERHNLEKLDFDVAQHQGYENRNLPKSCEEALNGWLKAVGSGELHYDAERLSENRALAGHAHARNLDENANLTDDQLKALWTLHQRFMSKDLKDAGSGDAWLEKVGFDKTIDALIDRGVEIQADSRQRNDLRNDMLGGIPFETADNPGYGEDEIPDAFLQPHERTPRGAVRAQGADLVADTKAEPDRPRRGLNWGRVMDALSSINPFAREPRPLER